MGDAGPGIGKARLHLRAEPGVIGLGFLGRRELGLDGGEFGHGGRIADGRVRANRIEAGQSDMEQDRRDLGI